MTKTGVVGYVAAFPIPEVIQGINALLLGARSVNPKATVKVIFTSSWFDPGKERAAADTLVAQGADYLTQHTDSTAVVQAAEEKGVWCSGYDSDMLKYGPKTHTTAVEMHLGRLLHRPGEAGDRRHLDQRRCLGRHGERHGEAVRFNPDFAAGAGGRDRREDRGDQVRQAGASFAGPLKDQAGAVKVPAGKAMTDAEILSMNWFVEGVQGKV